jgi:hypothetical protein
MFAIKVQTPCARSIAHFVAADPRADGGQRRVSLAAEAVYIDRRVAGVAMRLALPIGCFRGVSLAVLENARGFFYRVALDHADPELAVTLAESDSESDIAPEWKAWARFFNLPRLTFSPDGSPVVFDRRLGALVLGAVQPRKRGWPLKKRRSAISGRRIAGPKGRVQAMSCGERESVGAE